MGLSNHKERSKGIKVTLHTNRNGFWVQKKYSKKKRIERNVVSRKYKKMEEIKHNILVIGIKVKRFNSKD